MNDIIIEFKNTNLTPYDFNDWKEKSWKVYMDLSVKYNIKYLDSNLDKEANIRISTEELIKIIELLEKGKTEKDSDTSYIENDGKTWDVYQYDNGKLNCKLELNQVFGKNAIGNIDTFLNNLIENN